MKAQLFFGPCDGEWIMTFDGLLEVIYEDADDPCIHHTYHRVTDTRFDYDFTPVDIRKAHD